MNFKFSCVFKYMYLNFLKKNQNVMRPMYVIFIIYLSIVFYMYLWIKITQIKLKKIILEIKQLFGKFKHI